MKKKQDGDDNLKIVRAWFDEDLRPTSEEVI
jgi:hypothetical protein